MPCPDLGLDGSRGLGWDFHSRRGAEFLELEPNTVGEFDSGQSTNGGCVKPPLP